MYFATMLYNNTFRPEVVDALSIDCLIFGFQHDKLHILLVKHGEGISMGNWGLPGGWVLCNESLDQAAYRLLRDLTGLHDIFLEQLKAFGDPNRFPGKRVITIAYFALIAEDRYQLVPGFTASDACWFDLASTPELIYDHQQILDYGFAQLRHKVQHEPIGFNLLPERFTLLQLQSLYEAILGVKLDKPNFRRKILKMKLLVETGENEQNVSHRAAQLYRFDEAVYQRLLTSGFSFEL